jgi:ADP-ribose pyrophosphatase YjhB (NUDIX family)
VADCVIRETREETGLDIRVVGIVGIYSDPKHVFAYDHGEVRQDFSICLLVSVRDGTIQLSDESYEVQALDRERNHARTSRWGLRSG